MIRINLLPPEITQKRKDEKRWRWIALGGALALVIVAGVFAILQLQVALKAEEVAKVRQAAEAKLVETQRFKIFEVKEADLGNRRTIVSTALAGRMDWSRLFSEVSLVLPSDVYLTSLTGVEPKTPAAGDLTLSGQAIDFPNDVPDLGYKSVAKVLVRIAELEQVDNVWLSGGAAKPGAAAVDSTATQYINFTVSSKIPAAPASTPSTPGVPAPPN
jgi:Tfp pilus assembly protein PilN